MLDTAKREALYQEFSAAGRIIQSLQQIISDAQIATENEVAAKAQYGIV